MLSMENRDENVIISPASIKALLALIVEASTGATSTEILQALQMNRSDRQNSISLLRKLQSLLKVSSLIFILESNDRISVRK